MSNASKNWPLLSKPIILLKVRTQEKNVKEKCWIECALNFLNFTTEYIVHVIQQLQIIFSWDMTELSTLSSSDYIVVPASFSWFLDGKKSQVEIDKCCFFRPEITKVYD